MYGKEQNTKGAGGKKDRHTKEREREKETEMEVMALLAALTQKKKK